MTGGGNLTKNERRLLFGFLLLSVFFGIGSLTNSAVVPTGELLEPPSLLHIAGTDNIGIDIYAQISTGFFYSILNGLMAAAFAMLAGGTLGVLGGYLGGVADNAVSFAINLFLSVPQLPIMILIGAFFGQSRFNIILIVALFSWAPIAKIIQATTRVIKKSGYLQLAGMYGGKLPYLFRRHMLNDLTPLIIVNGLFVVGKAIIQESSLAFLGLADPTARSWGLMINKVIAYRGIYFTDYWKWWLTAPLLSLLVTTMLLRLLAREFERHLTAK
jgi:peptide/nickel transport system permease protein